MSATALVAILSLFLACVFPLVIIKRNNKRAEKRYRQSLDQIAEKHNGKIADYDVLKNLVIGFSEVTNTVFFLKKLNELDMSAHANVSEVIRCDLNKVSRDSVNGNYSSIEKVELHFSYKNKPDTVFEFYNLEHDSMSLTGELQLAQKWCKLIKSKMA